MRQNRKKQLPLSGLWPDHRLAQELKAVSKILDDNPSILDLVLHDLCDSASSGQGARGLSAEQVLRAALLKNWHQLSYTKLAFHLSDSQSFRRFARLPFHWSPSASCLQENISRIQASTWQQINRLLVGWADRQGLERGRKIRASETSLAMRLDGILHNWENIRSEAPRFPFRSNSAAASRPVDDQGRITDHRRASCPPRGIGSGPRWSLCLRSTPTSSRRKGGKRSSGTSCT